MTSNSQLTFGEQWVIVNPHFLIADLLWSDSNSGMKTILASFVSVHQFESGCESEFAERLASPQAVEQ